MALARDAAAAHAMWSWLEGEVAKVRLRPRRFRWADATHGPVEFHAPVQVQASHQIVQNPTISPSKSW